MQSPTSVTCKCTAFPVCFASRRHSRSTSAPFSLYTRLGVPEHDGPKKLTLGVEDEGDKAAKLAEKRRPGMVTFGEVTYF